jgi:hypothetical protein
MLPKKNSAKQNLPPFKSLFGHPSKVNTNGFSNFQRARVLSIGLNRAPYGVRLKRPYGTYNKELMQLLRYQKSFFDGSTTLGDFHKAYLVYIQSL